VPTSITTPGAELNPTVAQQPISAPAAQPIAPSAAPLVGVFELPTGPEDEGPPDGLTLDAALDITLARSLDLQTKYYEIPQARADTLQASLRANPAFYQDGQLLQYRRFDRSIPGGPSQYDTNITMPIDFSHKRQARTLVAARAEKVLEAQYQDAVRQRVDDVYGAYVTVLQSRLTIRFASQALKRLEDVAKKTEELYQRNQVSQTAVNQAKIQFRTARLGLVDAEKTYRKAKLDLGSFMNLPKEQALSIELKGSIIDSAPPPPPLDELLNIALDSRPDILAYRLGVKRAEADVRLARANRFNDAYLLYQPYTFQDNSPYGLKGAYSWALGVTVSLPVFNRNQGGIQRANLNVTQTQLQLTELERQTLIDVAKATEEYETTRREVEEFRNDVLPAARQVHDDALRLYKSGATSSIDLLNAELAFSTVVKQYLDTAISHRQSMLALNTAVGKRILP
jgi:cobalt-zinc-cadmium efflux system outer membrane protein